MTKITKQDIINNKLNCKLIPAYSIILSIVYDSWVYYTLNWLWLLILLPIAFVAIGLILTYLSTVKKKKQLESASKNEQ